MSTLWRIAGMLALATGLIMLINSCSGDSAAAVFYSADQLSVVCATPSNLAETCLTSSCLPTGQAGIGLAIARLQPNFDARPLQLQDGSSLEVETLATS